MLLRFQINLEESMILEIALGIQVLYHFYNFIIEFFIYILECPQPLSIPFRCAAAHRYTMLKEKIIQASELLEHKVTLEIRLLLSQGCIM